MKKLILLALLAVSAQAEVTEHRIDRLPERKITITAVEFTTEPVIQCDVFYWFPQDENMDGRIESCRNIEYDPCDPTNGQLKLVQFVLGGGSCDEPEEIQCDFSPKDPRCPE